MRILAHRGLWKQPNERNTISALCNALNEGFGFESDIRDYCGELVISHDPARSDSCKAHKIFELLHANNNQRSFAINIKADGLIPMLARELRQFHITNYFCFDMSVPQMIEYAQQGIRFFTRQSEYETFPPVLYEKAAGVWIDAFEDYSWVSSILLNQYLSDGKEVCLVSPELHNKEHMDFWHSLKASNLKLEHVILCTDLPKAAREYFKGDE